MNAFRTNRHFVSFLLTVCLLLGHALAFAGHSGSMLEHASSHAGLDLAHQSHSHGSEHPDAVSDDAPQTDCAGECGVCQLLCHFSAISGMAANPSGAALGVALAPAGFAVSTSGPPGLIERPNWH
jgi:hypothetical protein